MHQRRVELPHMAPEAIALSVELLVQLQRLSYYNSSKMANEYCILILHLLE